MSLGADSHDSLSWCRRGNLARDLQKLLKMAAISFGAKGKMVMKRELRQWKTQGKL